MSTTPLTTGWHLRTVTALPAPFTVLTVRRQDGELAAAPHSGTFEAEPVRILAVQRTGTVLTGRTWEGRTLALHREGTEVWIHTSPTGGHLLPTELEEEIPARQLTQRRADSLTAPFALRVTCDSNGQLRRARNQADPYGMTVRIVRTEQAGMMRTAFADNGQSLTLGRPQQQVWARELPQLPDDAHHADRGCQGLVKGMHWRTTDALRPPFLLTAAEDHHGHWQTAPRQSDPAATLLNLVVTAVEEHPEGRLARTRSGHEVRLGEKEAQMWIRPAAAPASSRLTMPASGEVPGEVEELRLPWPRWDAEDAVLCGLWLGIAQIVAEQRGATPGWGEETSRLCRALEHFAPVLRPMGVSGQQALARACLAHLRIIARILGEEARLEWALAIAVCEAPATEGLYQVQQIAGQLRYERAEAPHAVLERLGIRDAWEQMHLALRTGELYDGDMRRLRRWALANRVPLPRP